ncbi:MAG: universal stress protein, partial [Planctomycetes bacterium]|nr:universal stress protein [Planctomycetota bacterium]
MKIDTIIVASDLSDCAASALRVAARLAPAFGSTLRVVHVLEAVAPPEVIYYGLKVAIDYEEHDLAMARQELKEWIERTLPEGCPEYTTLFFNETAATEIDAEAEEI